MNRFFLVVVLMLSACTKGSSTEGAAGCEKSGHYTHQADCVDDTAHGCVAHTVQNADQNLVCWKPSP